jgi:hypothetical protein
MHRLFADGALKTQMKLELRRIFCVNAAMKTAAIAAITTSAVLILRSGRLRPRLEGWQQNTMVRDARQAARSSP